MNLLRLISEAQQRIQRQINGMAYVALSELHEMAAEATKHINRCAGQRQRRQREAIARAKE